MVIMVFSLRSVGRTQLTSGLCCAVSCLPCAHSLRVCATTGSAWWWGAQPVARPVWSRHQHSSVAEHCTPSPSTQQWTPQKYWEALNRSEFDYSCSTHLFFKYNGSNDKICENNLQKQLNSIGLLSLHKRRNVRSALLTTAVSLSFKAFNPQLLEMPTAFLIILQGSLN